MKRFTETEKWRDPWFRKLKPMTKLAFQYIVDTCDNAGVWDPDFDLANFQIGDGVAWPLVLEELGDRVRVLENGRWYLTRFIEFQYGELMAECRPHQKVLSLLRLHGLPYRKGIRRVSVSTGKEEDQDQEGGTGGNVAPPPIPTPEEIYEAYPLKMARQDALKAIRRVLLERPTFAADLLARTRKYAEAVARWSEDDRRYVPHAATWFNRGSYDDDPKNWERKHANDRTGNNRSFSQQQDYSGVTDK